MDKDDFWGFVNAFFEAVYKPGCLLGVAALSAQARAVGVTEGLAGLKPDNILDYQSQLHERIQEAGTADLWNAAYLMQRGYCFDDGFLYIRAWLVSQGRQTFEKALAAPDSLAEVQPEASDETLEPNDEDFLYAGLHAFPG